MIISSKRMNFPELKINPMSTIIGFIYLVTLSFLFSQNKVPTHIYEYVFEYQQAKTPFYLISQSNNSRFSNRYEIENDKIFAAPTEDAITELIIKDYETATLYNFNFLDGQTVFITDTEPIRWNILDETKKIHNYTCQKAETTFRGRNYEAWFTTDIPIPDGPWKFRGLPGLIVYIRVKPAVGSSYQFSYELVKASSGYYQPFAVKEYVERNLQQKNNLLPMSFEEFKTSYAEYKRNQIKQRVAKFKLEGSVTFSQTEGKEILFEYPDVNELKRMLME